MRARDQTMADSPIAPILEELLRMHVTGAQEDAHFQDANESIQYTQAFTSDNTVFIHELL